jgi:hypothetical protein
MTEKNNDAIQAKHHHLIPFEEVERAYLGGMHIGYADVASHIASHVDPYLAPSLTHALKYQTRLGRKDDERQEVEKAIWYLMDLHNRIADLRKEPRDFAPWHHLGKLSQLPPFHLYTIVPEPKDSPTKELPNFVPEVELIHPKPVVEKGFITYTYWPDNSFNYLKSHQKSYLSKKVFKDGDEIMFYGLYSGSLLINEKWYKLTESKGKLAIIINGIEITHGFEGVTMIQKKVYK